MTEIMKVGMLGIIGVLIAIQFRTQKPEYGIYIGLALGVILLGYGLKQFAGILEVLGAFRGYLGLGEHYLTVLLKVIGITYICEFCASICKDAGYGTVASQIEILGKLAVMIAGVPILLAVAEQLQLLAA